MSRLHARVLIRRFHLAPAIHGTAGNALEHHDFTRPRRGQRREDEIFPDGRRDIEGDAGRRVGGKPGDVGQSERALRLVERRAFGVAFEQLDDVALATGQNHKIAIPGIVFQIGNAGFVDREFAATLLKLLHPARILDPLVDRLSRLVERVDPRDRLAAVRPRNGDAEAVRVRALLLPVVEAEIALGLQRVVEHELARHHLAGGEVFCRPVGDEANPIAVLQKAEAQLQAGLAGADDGNVAHLRSPREIVVWPFFRQFVIPSAKVSPDRRAPAPWPYSRRRRECRCR